MALSNNAPILYKIVQGEQLLWINYKKHYPTYTIHNYARVTSSYILPLFGKSRLDFYQLQCQFKN